MAASTKIGLDIGTSMIKAVVINGKTTPPTLISVGSIASPQPGILSDSDLDMEAVGGAIKNLISDIKPPTKEVVLSLPESRVFTRVIYDLPYLTDDELNQAIKYAAEEFVPMPIKDVNLYFQMIYRSPKKEPKSRTVVFVVATPKVLIDKYIKLVQMTELKASAIETDLIGVTRILGPFNPNTPTTLLIQLGASSTDYAVTSEGLILLTRSISTGGTALTRAISQNFNFEMNQAEEYKKVYGLQEEQLEGKLFKAIKPVIDVILNEAHRMMLSFEMQNRQRPIKRIVLSGGTAQLPGLVKYVTNALGVEVGQIDPWSKIYMEPTIKSKLTSEGPAYSLATGLALRDD